jgi:hypothetical protein
MPIPDDPKDMPDAQLLVRLNALVDELKRRWGPWRAWEIIIKAFGH